MRIFETIWKYGPVMAVFYLLLYSLTLTKGHRTETWIFDLIQSVWCLDLCQRNHNKIWINQQILCLGSAIKCVVYLKSICPSPFESSFFIIICSVSGGICMPALCKLLNISCLHYFIAIHDVSLLEFKVFAW